MIRIGRRKMCRARRPMPRSRIQRLTAAMLAELELTAPLDVQELCERLGRHRGRPIELVPHQFPEATAFGLRLGTASADYLFYEQHATPEHQRHIILHEIGHVFLDHGHDDAVWRTLVPTLSPDVVRRALRRSSYEDPSEDEAENFASIVLEWSEVMRTSAVHAPDRLRHALSHPAGWL